MPMPLSILDVVDAIKQQVANRALGTEPQPAQPNLTPEPPPDVDYTQGMTRPDLTELGSKMEFKATPSRASAMLVALGNILQDRRNVEAAKQAASQSEYNAKLENAMDLNKARKGLQMKREFDEADPDVLMGRKLKQAELDMLPLKKEAAMADLLFKTKRADQYGQARGGRVGSGVGDGGEQVDDTFKGILLSKIKQYDPITKRPLITPEAVKEAWEDFLLTNPKTSSRIAAQNFVAPYLPKEPGKITPFEQAYNSIKKTGLYSDDEAYAMAKQKGFKPDKPLDRYRAESREREIGAMEGMMNYMNEATGEGTTSATKPALTPTRKSVQERAAELAAQGIDKEKAREIMKGEGY